MKTLKLTMTIAALALSSVICQAQPHAKYPNKNDKGAKLVEKLGLNEKQAEALKVIHENQKLENKALTEKMAPLKAELKTLKAEKKALNEIKMKEIEAILTPEQFAKFKEMKEHRKDRVKEKRGNY